MNETQRNRGKQIHRETGRTFYYATRLLPERIREQTYVLYGFFRIADEIVDGETASSPTEQREQLETLRESALGRREADDPVVAAFSEIREETGIADVEVNAFIDAMLSDIETNRYETYNELESYMRGSAAAVGNMMLALMDADDPQTREHAMALGEGFQLTNFLRDVSEDIDELDRVYLPQETLLHHGASVDDIRQKRCTPEFRNAIKAELNRAEQRYRVGIRGIELLPRDCQFAVLLSAVLYAEHHRLIRANEYDVLSTRPTLSRTRKLWVIARTWWHWRKLRDPVTVFERVSAVPTDDTGTEERVEEGRGRGIPSPE